MKKCLENLELNELNDNDLVDINGGGILRKYGEYLGEKIGGLLIYVGGAVLVRRLI